MTNFKEGDLVIIVQEADYDSDKLAVGTIGKVTRVSDHPESEYYRYQYWGKYFITTADRQRQWVWSEAIELVYES